MGNINKDPNLDIHLEILKPVYTAGDIVEGVLHLNVKSKCIYSGIYISFISSQKVQWIRRYGNVTVIYKNARQTYNSEFQLAIFRDAINPGHYSFPFNFLLPYALPGNLYRNNENYIKYIITAQMPSLQNNGINQSCQFNLQIQEPQRSQIKLIKLNETSISKCCNCCCNNGVVYLQFSSSTNFIRTGDTITCTGFIDNSQRKSDIDSFQIVLKQQMLRISENAYTTHSIENTFVLKYFEDKILSGTSKDFMIQLQIPTEIASSTAVGQIIERYFTLQLIINGGCCFSNPSVALPIVLNSTKQNIQQNQMKLNVSVEAPQSWNPLIQEKLIVKNMKPYIYIPMPGITNRNQGNGQILQMPFSNEYPSQQIQMNIKDRSDQIEPFLVSDNFSE